MNKKVIINEEERKKVRDLENLNLGPANNSYPEPFSFLYHIIDCMCANK